MKNRYDIITEVKKFNPYHDRLGRFTTAQGATMAADGKGGGGGTKKPAKNKNVATEVDSSWGKYDQSVGRSQLANYGRIYLDSYGKPIDDIYETDRKHARYTAKNSVTSNTKTSGANKKKEIQKLEDKADALERELMEELSTSGPGNHSKGWREARTKKIRELRDEARELKYGRKTRS